MGVGREAGGGTGASGREMQKVPVGEGWIVHCMVSKRSGEAGRDGGWSIHSDLGLARRSAEGLLLLVWAKSMGTCYSASESQTLG